MQIIFASSVKDLFRSDSKFNPLPSWSALGGAALSEANILHKALAFTYSKWQEIKNIGQHKRFLF